MDRRKFIRIAGTASAIAMPGFKVASGKAQNPPDTGNYSNYRGFNLLAKFYGGRWQRKFEEEDFEIMADWGFDFARIPMSYWNWASIDDWYTIDEEFFNDIDEVIELGRQYNIHINLNI